jgi:hypothetical protein
MKALKVFAVAMVGLFIYGSASAQVHHSKRYHHVRKVHHVYHRPYHHHN